MAIERKSRNWTPKTPLQVCLLAVASSVALAGVVVTLSTRTVQADARLPRPLQTAPAASPAASATPATLEPQATAVKRGDRLHGLASWYGGIFNGRHTASGERFDMHAMTACHPTLPFGSLVRVINLTNRRSVVVRITDRGDLVNEGRIIDLSYGAAEKLAMTRDGLAKVDLEIVSLGKMHGNK
jgi:rare lipoprotein A